MNAKSDNQRICKYLEFKQQTNRQPKFKKLKSAGCDGIAVEMIKNAPKTIDQKSCKYIFNNISETTDVPENYPKHLKRSKDYHQTYDQWPCSQR